jgi:hypothetical protein
VERTVAMMEVVCRDLKGMRQFGEKVQGGLFVAI